MCVALPGKVVAIEEKYASVDFSGNLVKARSGLVPVKVGDYVLVHAGCIMQIVKPDDVEELMALMEEVDAYS